MWRIRPRGVNLASLGAGSICIGIGYAGCTSVTHSVQLWQQKNDVGTPHGFASSTTPKFARRQSQENQVKKVWFQEREVDDVLFMFPDGV